MAQQLKLWADLSQSPGGDFIQQNQGYHLESIAKPPQGGLHSSVPGFNRWAIVGKEYSQSKTGIAGPVGLFEPGPRIGAGFTRDR